MELKCSKEELNELFAKTYGDQTRHQPLGVLEGLPESALERSVAFYLTTRSKREFGEEVKRTRS